MAFGNFEIGYFRYRSDDSNFLSLNNLTQHPKGLKMAKLSSLCTERRGSNPFFPTPKTRWPRRIRTFYVETLKKISCRLWVDGGIEHFIRFPPPTYLIFAFKVDRYPGHKACLRQATPALLYCCSLFNEGKLSYSRPAISIKPFIKVL